MLRVMRIIHTFPNQKFVLLGDNSQSDPVIYEAIASKYPHQIFAVFIRNIKPVNEAATRQTLALAEQKGVHTFLYTESADAIVFAKKTGLIE